MDTLSGNYKTDQSYEYDDLYQLIHVTGNTEYYPAISSVPDYKSTYTQDFAFDDKGLGNMMSKVSKETVSPLKVIGDNLNYNIGYVYDENYAHRLVQAGNRYYKYDANGNIICEQDGSFDDSENDVSYYKVEQHSEDVYSTDNGWGLFKDESSEGRGQTHRYRRTYTWNSRNQLVSSVDSNYSTLYVYGQDGQRSNKYTQGSETLYFNKMWTLHTDNGNSVYGGQYAKNVYLGETRIVTKLARADQKTAHEEMYKQYYYHSDHLGSATMITDWEGKEYQRIEYTPYGETWVEKTNNSGSEFLPYKFTGKEVDQETGLYYYGARYLDPKYSMWLSTDPALGEYVPEMGKGIAKDSGNLPGMGGVFNHINGNLYAYGANNPIKYTDPDGRITINAICSMFMNKRSAILGIQPNRGGEDQPKALTIGGYGCVVTFYARLASTISGEEITPEMINDYAIKNNLFEVDTSDSYYDVTLLSPEAGVKAVNGILKEKGITNVSLDVEDTIYSSNMTYICNTLNKYDSDKKNYYIYGLRIDNKHTINLNKDFSKSNPYTVLRNWYCEKETSRVKYGSVNYNNPTILYIFKVNFNNEAE
ncbi:MAG: RHS repeat-associated core domain-containing protein [Spirochaetia bacterium]|nr:RHS repeat-associated core domain-containing protein [Spirochaetia bacterium]